MNKVALIGRVTRDIELRYTQDQKPVCKFTIAVDRRNNKNEADFISCTAWNRIAELLEQYVKKGQKIGIIGHIQTGSFTDKNGDKHFTTDVVVDEMDFIDRGEAKPEDKKPDGFMTSPDSVDDADLPF